MGRAKEFIVNTAIMTVTSLLLQGISMAFNVYISNRIGGEGVGLFSVIMSVNGLMVTLSTGGVHVTTVKLVSSAAGRDAHREIFSAMVRCTVFALICGIATGLTGFFSAEWISREVLADERSIRCIKILSLLQPVNSLSCVVGGYLGAQRKVKRSAAVQIADEAITVIAVTLGLRVLLPKGIEYACIAVIGGSGIAHIITTLGAVASVVADSVRLRAKGGAVPDGLTSNMLKIAVPVAVTSYARSGLSTVKNLLIPHSLRLGGVNAKLALEQYGILQGMAFPVIMFPQIVTGAMAGLLVPEITKSKVLGYKNNTAYIISRALQVTGIYSVGISVIVFAFSDEICRMIYSNGAVAQYIKMMAFLIPLLYTDSVVDAALSGVDKQIDAMKISITDSILSIILVTVLLPHMGIKGYVVAMYICKIFNCAVSVYILVRSAGVRLRLVGWIFTPVLCAAGAVLAIRTLSSFWGADNVYRSIPEMILSGYAYVGLLCLTGCIKGSDVEWIRDIFRQNSTKN